MTTKEFLDQKAIELGYEDIIHWADCRDYEKIPFDLIVWLPEFARMKKKTK